VENKTIAVLLGDRLDAKKEHIILAVNNRGHFQKTLRESKFRYLTFYYLSYL